MPSTLSDTNFLLALLFERHAQHPAALKWLQSSEEQGLVVCRIVQLAVLRLLGNSTVMGKDLKTPQEASEVWEVALSDSRISIEVAEPPLLDQFLLSDLGDQQRSDSYWVDKYLDAFSAAAGLPLVTFDRGLAAMAGPRAILLEG